MGRPQRAATQVEIDEAVAVRLDPEAPADLSRPSCSPADRRQQRTESLLQPDSIADIAVYGYSHRAHEAEIDLDPYRNVRRWLERVEAEPGYLEDLEPYPDSARQVSRPIYD